MKPWETDDTFLSRWLNGELSEEELTEFKASPEYEAYLATTSAFDQVEVGAYAQDQALGKLMTRIREAKPPVAAKTISLRRVWWMAAAAVVILLLIVGSLRVLDPNSRESYFAESQLEVALPDGSEVSLAPGSSVEYLADSWMENREVYLKGEAYFDVREGEAFEVILENGQVMVLGTTFEITEFPDRLEVTCFTGKVRVEAYGIIDTLMPQQFLTLYPNQPPTLQNTSLDQPSWLSSKISLENRPLSQVIDQVEEIYEIKIIGLVDQDLVYTGVFPTDDLETALSQVFDPFRIKYELDPYGHVVTIQ